MEVRTKETGYSTAAGASPPLEPSSGETPTHLDRIATTAARALGVPNVCVYLLGSGSEMERCYGPGSDVLASFCRSVFGEVSREEGTVFHSEPGGEASGDGAPSISYVGVPLEVRDEFVGLVLALDYAERTYSTKDIALIDEFVSLAAGEVQRNWEIQDLRRSEERFRAVTENTQDVVAILDHDARFTYVSPSARSIFGKSPSELIGREIYGQIFGEDVPLLRSGLEPRLSSRRQAAASMEGDAGTIDGVLDADFRVIASDGLRYMRLLGNSLFDRKGVDGYLIHIRDVTDRAESEAEISKSRDRAKEMNRLKSVFLTNMSHEIRTPLTTILGFAEILADEVDEEALEFVNLIQKGGERLMDTLMSILDLARLESSSFDLSAETFDVAEKIGEICRLMSPLAEEKGLSVSYQDSDEPIDVALDLSAVERIANNLLSNAIKFTREGDVTVSLEADADHLLIHVADTGIGIGEEFMPFLFEDFKQESEGLARMHEGSGLGLSITKRLVELMKGNIMAESEKGRGTVFTVALPRNGEAAVLGTSTDRPSEDVSRTKVLVVEDNADTRTLVNHLLRKNYDVRCATDADEALELAAEQRYDVLLVDINLGKGKSGEDVLHAVRSLPNYTSVPVIAVTAYAMPGDRERFFAEGFDDYVSKPFSKQRLLEALEGVLA